MRRLLLAATIGLTAGLACSLDDDLENKPCLENADCWTNQVCVGTHAQLQGWCRPKGAGCAKGEQPGCACDISTDGTMPVCAYELVTAKETSVGVYVANDQIDGCVCVSMETLEGATSSSST